MSKRMSWCVFFNYSPLIVNSTYIHIKISHYKFWTRFFCRLAIKKVMLHFATFLGLLLPRRLEGSPLKWNKTLLNVLHLLILILFLNNIKIKGTVNFWISGLRQVKIPSRKYSKTHHVFSLIQFVPLNN